MSTENNTTETTRTGYFCGLRGLSISMTQAQADSASHQGQCDDDVTALARHPSICAQLDAIDAEDIRAALKEYGAWDAEELSDDAQNRHRAVWLAACDIRENPETETEQAEQEQQETAASATTDPYKSKFHRDGTVTFWNVYQQVWTRMRAGNIADCDLASMSQKDRARTIATAAR